MIDKQINNFLNLDMLRQKVSKHILKLRIEKNLNEKDFAPIINTSIRTAQLRFKKDDWTFEEIEAIENYFGVKILYSANDYFAEDNIKAVIQIELKNKQKDKILKQLIGKADLEIINNN